MSQLETLIELYKSMPEKIEFQDVIKTINEHYLYTPSRFTNGPENSCIINAAGENEGSCKIFSFALMHQFNETQTLNCFGRYYREDVLSKPEGSDHANIRSFIKHGWEYIGFDKPALELKE